MSASENRERRNHFRGKPRPGRRVDVEVRQEGQPALKAHTQNVGVGGAFIVCAAPPAPGTLLEVSLLVPGNAASGHITVKAEVRWTVPEGELTGMGVKFLSLEVDELLALNEYFATLTGAEPGPGLE